MLKTEVDLSQHNTLGLPCTAQYFAVARSVHDLQDINQQGQSLGLPLFVLGGGSNIILPERLNAVVVSPQLAGLQVNDAGDAFNIALGGGEHWHRAILELHEQGVEGLENLALIPGLAGAAPIQNIGAYGVEVADYISAVEVLDLASNQCQTLLPKQCEFGYRDSVFKNALRGKVIITQLYLIIPKHNAIKCDYPSLNQALEQQGITSPTSADVLNTVIQVRSQRLPDPADKPNAGSFFKNPIVSQQHCEQLLVKHPAMPNYAAGNNQRKLAAGWLIDQCGYKGKSQGPVGCHQQQALVMVNHGGATQSQVLAFAAQVAAAVQQQFDVTLNIEPLVVDEHGQF